MRRMCLGVFCVCLVMFGRSVRAGVVLYETGFEPPAFAAGLPLVGQSGWSAIGDISAGAATIDDQVAAGGLQSVRVDGGLVEQYQDFYGGFWYVPVVFDPIAAGKPIVEVSVDVLLQHASGDPTTVDQISANFQVYDASLNYLAGIYYSPDGTIMGDNYDFEAVTGSVASLDEWARLGLRLDYQSRRVDYLLNGLVFGSLALSGPGSGFGEVDLSFAARVPFQSVAHFDNYSIRAAAVPEPGTLALASIPALMSIPRLLSRRRCRARTRKAARRPARLLSRLAPLLFLLLFLSTTPAAHADLIVSDAARNVFARGELTPFFFDEGTTNSITSGAFLDTIGIDYEDDTGKVSATAFQQSTFPNLVGPAASGLGIVDGLAETSPGVEASYQTASNAQMTFTVSAAQIYRLSGYVQFISPVRFNAGGSTVELLDATNGTTLFYGSSGELEPGTFYFDYTFHLQTGIEYVLDLFTTVGINPISDGESAQGHGEWSFEFAPMTTAAVPEPASATVLLIGAGLALAARGRARLARGIRAFTPFRSRTDQVEANEIA